MRLNMSTSLKVALSAISVAALLASPAMAKTRSHIIGPYYGSAGAYYGYGNSYVGAGGPYTPSLPTLRYGPNRDFQSGGSRG
jgi:hypothetical protein